MGQSNIGIRFNIDVSQAKGQVDELSKTVSGLKDQIAQATKAGDWKSVAQLSEAMNNTTSARGQIMKQANEVQTNENREKAKNGIFGSDSSDFGKFLLAQTLTKLTDGIIQALEKGFTAAKQRAGGDLTGAAVTERGRTGDAIGTGVGLATTILGTMFFGPMAGAFAGSIAERITTFIANHDTREMEKDLVYSTQYKKVFPEIDTLNQLYGGNINRKSLEENNTHGLKMFGRATSAADWTGLTTSQFVEAMKQMGGYGIRSETQALNMTQNQALWSRFTGADLSTIQKYAGQSYRYGGEYGGVSTAYGALMANNMGKGQFSEFLNSMARIMEEGISKGFVKSSSQIAGNMTMLYKLSGNSSLWQGEQGAQRLSQMNNAITNSTKLESVEDVMNFAAAKEIFNSRDFDKVAFEKSGAKMTNSYADYMQLLEQGVNSKMIGKQFAAVRNISNGDTATMIERFRTMYGLNYTGAAQVWDMSNKMKDDKTGEYTPEKIAAKIEGMKTDPQYQSDSAKLQNVMNKVADNLANIGQIKFDETEWGLIETQADDVAQILATLRGGDPLPGISRQVLTEHTRSLPVSHSMIFNDAAIRPGTEGLDAYNQVRERYFSIIQGHDERDFLSNVPAMHALAEFIPAAIADGNFTSTGRHNEFEQANELLDALERGIAIMINNMQQLTEQARNIQREGIPINGDLHVTDN